VRQQNFFLNSKAKKIGWLNTFASKKSTGNKVKLFSCLYKGFDLRECFTFPQHASLKSKSIFSNTNSGYMVFNKNALLQTNRQRQKLYPILLSSTLSSDILFVLFEYVFEIVNKVGKKSSTARKREQLDSIFLRMLQGWFSTKQLERCFKRSVQGIFHLRLLIL